MSSIKPGVTPWQYRAIEATGGNTSLLGCFLLAILGWQTGRKPPRFGRIAVIDAQGIVYSNMQDKDGRMYRNHCLGPIATIRDNFRGLADHIKCDDDERNAMFAELKKWFVHDARANQSNKERGLNS